MEFGKQSTKLSETSEPSEHIVPMAEFFQDGLWLLIFVTFFETLTANYEHFLHWDNW